jgi:hypothetical protein
MSPEYLIIVSSGLRRYSLEETAAMAPTGTWPEFNEMIGGFSNFTELPDSDYRQDRRSK